MRCQGAVLGDGRLMLERPCGRTASAVATHRLWGTAPLCPDHEHEARSPEGVWVRSRRARSATLWGPEEITAIEEAA